MNSNGIINFFVKADFDTQKVNAELSKKVKRAQMKLDIQVIKDSNYYCPLDTSMLQKSATLGTVAGSGLIEWRTPYAKRQYYGVKFDHSKSDNPNATAMWFESAKARKEKQWEQLVNDTIKHG